MVVHSLLDGPSAAGAYRFTIRPGRSDRRSTSRRRSSPATSIAHIGLAPLTSMFLFDAKDRADARRLPPRRAQFRRARDVERLGRAALAAAALAAAPADQRLRRFGAARLRADPARAATSPTTRISAAALPPAPERLGRADRRLGQGARRAGRDPDQRRDPRQYRRLLAAGGRRWPPASEISLTYRLSWGWDVARSQRASAGRAHPDRRRRRRPAALRRRLRRRGPGPRLGGAAGGAGQPRQRSTTPRSRRTPRSRGLRLKFDLDPEGADVVEMRMELRSGDRRIAETWVYRWSS